MDLTQGGRFFCIYLLYCLFSKILCNGNWQTFDISSRLRLVFRVFSWILLTLLTFGFLLMFANLLVEYEFLLYLVLTQEIFVIPLVNYRFPVLQLILGKPLGSGANGTHNRFTFLGEVFEANWDGQTVAGTTVFSRRSQKGLFCSTDNKRG